MNRHRRLERLLSLIIERGSMSVEEVVEELRVSPATVRRDFERLAEQQLINRTRGGAVAASTSYDLPLLYRAGRRAEEKERIAKAVVDLIRPGSVIGLNGGTTALTIGRAMSLHRGFHVGPGETGITVVTTALNLAAELAVRPHVKVVVAGGVVRPRSYEVFGPLADRLLDSLTLDVVVLGVDALSLRTGAMAFDEGEAATNAQLAARAAKTIVAADSSKLDAKAFARIVPVDAIDVVVTDAGVDHRFIQELRNADVTAVVA